MYNTVVCSTDSLSSRAQRECLSQCQDIGRHGIGRNASLLGSSSRALDIAATVGDLHSELVSSEYSQSPVVGRLYIVDSVSCINGPIL